MTVPTSLLVSSGICVGVSACVSTGLAFYATFAVSLVFLVRVLSPELVDGAFADVDDCVPREARLACDAIGYEAGILRAEARNFWEEAQRDPVIAAIYARAEEHARRAHELVTDGVDVLKRTARAKWGGFKDAAAAALLLIRLIAGVVNLAATVLTTIAFEEAKSRAPSVLRWRGVKRITSPPNEEGQPEAAVPRGSKPDTTLLAVWISAIVMYCTQVLVLDALCSGMTTFAAFFACFAALCGFALMEAERVYLWDSYDIAAGDSSTANPAGRRVGNAAVGIDLRDAWESLWFQIVLTYFIDACFLCIVLGKRPLALASLAICSLTALRLARQVYLTQDDGEEANGSGDGGQGDVNKWRRAVMAVLAIDSAKVFVTYLVLDFFLGALCFASLCARMAFLFDKAVCLPGVHAAGDDDNQEGAGLDRNPAGDAEGSDDAHNQEGAGLALDIAGDAEGSDDVRAEDPSAVAACDHEKEGSVTDERSGLSDSEEEAGEQRHDEPEYSSSSSMDDWSHVGVDPMMPTNVNGGAGWKLSFLSMGVRR